MSLRLLLFGADHVYFPSCCALCSYHQIENPAIYQQSILHYHYKKQTIENVEIKLL